MQTTMFISLTLLSIVFANDGSCYDRSNWMKTLTPYIKNIPLTNIYIPGSHESATKGFPLYAGCQASDIPSQFSKGARLFDLRYCGLVGGIGICHGTDMPPLSATYRWLDHALRDIASVAQKYPEEIIILKLQENNNFGLKNFDDLYNMVHQIIGPHVINSAMVPVTLTYGEIKSKTTQNIYVVFEIPGCKNKNKPICKLSDSVGFNDGAYLGDHFIQYSSDTVPALLNLTLKYHSPKKLIVTQFINLNPDPKGYVAKTNSLVNVMIGALFKKNIKDIILLNFMTTTGDDNGAAHGCTATNKIIYANMLPGGSYIQTCNILDISPIGSNFTAACNDNNGKSHEKVYRFPPAGTNSCDNKNGSITC